MRHIMVRYKLKPERVSENEQLVHAVYEELDRTQPAGFNYATFKLNDGVTFIHLASHQDTDNPLQRVEAFQRFQQRIGERCDESPAVAEVEEIGSYRFRKEPS
jgi:hypothetical protein